MALTKAKLIADNAVKAVHIDETDTGITLAQLNVTGDITATNVAGTLSTAAQPNITSVGTLSSLGVSGNLTVDTNTLYVDAVNNYVGVRTSDANTHLDVNGTIGVRLNNLQFGRIKTNNADADSGGLTFQYNDNAVFTDGLVLNYQGNVGIGISNPNVKLYIRETNAASAIFLDSTATTDQLNRIASLRSSGGAYSSLLIDANTHIFRIGTTERMRIDSSGSLLVGGLNRYAVGTQHLIQGTSSSPGQGAVMVYNDPGTANCPALTVCNRDESTDSSNRFIQFYASVGATVQAMGGIVGNGATNVQFASLSDEREKENIVEISGSLNKIMQIQVSEFDWIKTGEHINAGFIAQNVETVFPEYVVENITNEGEEPRKGITGGMSAGYIAHLTKAMQELKEIIDNQQIEIDNLKAQLNG